MNKERFKFLINNLFIKALFPINILLSLVFRHIKKKKKYLTYFLSNTSSLQNCENS